MAPAERGLRRALQRARPGRRLTLVLAVYLLLAGAITIRLVSVQLVDTEGYAEDAAAQTQQEIELSSRRGAILDREGQPLAISVPAAAVYGDPAAIEGAGIDPTWIAAELAPLLERPTGELVDELSTDRRFVYLGRQLPREVGEEVADLELPGVGVLEEHDREYPAGSLAAQALGHAGIDGDGLAGLEAAHEGVLQGTPGRLARERGRSGASITAANMEREAAEPGEDLTTTIDRGLQADTERILAETIDEYGAQGASAVVLAPGSGEVLAMASTPGYEPEAIEDAPEYARRNRPLTDAYEPGSVLKALTVATALEEGVVTADETLSVPAAVEVAGQRFTDVQTREDREADLGEIVAESSNVGVIELAQQLGPERLAAGLQRFGLGQPTEIGFPGESAGSLPAPDDWSATSLPTIAMGQGVSVSLTQTAAAFAVLANDGERMAPRLLRDEPAAPGDASRVDGQRVISPDTAAQVTGLLEGVVEEGTGTAAGVPGYAVAGKTGTAQKPSTTERGYEEGAYLATFAGYAPAEDPAVVVAIMVDEPQDEYFGGVVAAPAFAEITATALERLRIPPDDPRAAEEEEPADPDPEDAADGPPGISGPSDNESDDGDDPSNPSGGDEG
ncbi:penicillin-binding protein 2 [Egibacter rhizosphaerae]|uniref:Penicillin-binding protein 2 n=1 Tax=Egibacter rhizosphaerae TaxID=1670831 RepID=A0A411YAD5_9ACTN|nr:penicillin-binding protein 2 [Egibacter rhizosphaerae]QBI18137.1 penicillin-binding protein 2 [Egibacter rhizosphaerae]